MEKYVYRFEEGSKDGRDLLGGKGANLAEMTILGLPVPRGFTITTAACMNYLQQKEQLDDTMKGQIELAIEQLQTDTGKMFGASENPLFVSVRSGAKFSMPGMMDTILNLGLNDTTVTVFAEQTKNPTFAYDCYRRLLQMFGDVVFRLPKTVFDIQLDRIKELHDYKSDQEMQAEDWQQLVQIYKDIYVEKLHRPFPQEPKEQLYLAVEAVFRSWLNPRAQTYRRLHGISEKLGTAVNIQEMVFGNFSNESGTGVAFTRNPATGEKGLFGEFLINAQGEDVVAGIRTPSPIKLLNEEMPHVYAEFLKITQKLEDHYRDMQDIEFTIENGKLFILQTRNGKRTAKAAFQIAVELVKEGIIEKQEAVLRMDPEGISQILHAVFDTNELRKHKAVAQGLPASPGAATGHIYFEAADAKAAYENGERVILVRQETSPEDIEGMLVSEGIVTSRGGMTSHAAVVARGMGVCCVAGCEELKVSELLKRVETASGEIFSEGDVISVDGSTGSIYAGRIPIADGKSEGALTQVLEWADEFAQLRVFANAETKKDIEIAASFGARGIGLARTEHMFFGEGRIQEMRKMILAETAQERSVPLSKLKEMQKEDFKMMFRIFGEEGVTIRLLDPPLHEFLPHTEEEICEMSGELGISVEKIRERVIALAEVNPMLGHRGCRLAVTYPDIYKMQAAAIMEGAIEAGLELGRSITPHIMIPLIGSVSELELVKNDIQEALADCMEQKGRKNPVEIGTMIEIPRACMVAEKIAEQVDFFSFGTNDLTQLTYGFSRDDAGKFINEYIAKGILKNDPFQVLDEEGVGHLMKQAVENGRNGNRKLTIGVCGEVGGNPKSLPFLQDLGLNYVSCSPYRVPAARLAAGQEGLRSGR